jgi:hypothetical protein
MGLFSGFKKSIIKAKYATELEIVLDAYTKKVPVSFSKGKIASELVSASWQKNADLFDNELGGKPNKYAVITTSLSECIHRFDLNKGEKHLLMAALGDIIKQLEETNFSGYSSIDRALILQAKKVFMNFK